jgi:hypothetical protein
MLKHACVKLKIFQIFNFSFIHGPNNIVVWKLKKVSFISFD